MRKRIDPARRLVRLRWFLGLLFLGLAIPAALLIRQGFAQLELGEFRRQQLLAEDLVRSIDARLIAAIAVEDARPATDFDYAVTPSAGAGNVVQLSPLSSLAAANAFPGTIGYFQVNSSGELSTPLLPASTRDTVPDPERQAKAAIEAELADVLEANRLLRASPNTPPPSRVPAAEAEADRFEQPVATARAGAARNEAVRGQAAFDELAGFRTAEIRSLDDAAASPERSREERADSDQQSAAVGATSAVAPASVRVSTFAGDLEPLRFSLLETGHFVLFRNAWRDGERFVQGMLIDRTAFVTDTVDRAFLSAGLAPGTRLTVSAAGADIATLEADAGGGDDVASATALYSARLSPPLAEIEVTFASGRLERGPGFGLLAWTAIVLFGVLVGGLFAMYRYGVQQLRLARQQQNFVSAVSHELKTPLTSIRMYGEMLKSGWADEEKKQMYYDYIFEEGERLSRLIENVLQLARLNRGGPDLDLEAIAVSELFDVLRSKLASQAERSGFELAFEIGSGSGDLQILGDIDALSQIFINLVDNAIKFQGESQPRKIVISARGPDKGNVVLAVRDFGPGIPPAELKRLFELFYRPDNELTRSTAGTGIGLALVRQLATAMSGRVDVGNRDPGAEFRIILPDAASP